MSFDQNSIIKKDPNANPKLRIALSIAGILFLAVGFMIAIFFCVVVIQPYWMASGGMEPALNKGDRVLVSRWRTENGELKKGQIIAFRNQKDKRVSISRIVGLPGEQIDTKDEKSASSNNNKTMIPPGCVFVLSDNPQSTTGSRMEGLIDKKTIIGRIFLRLWPNPRFFSD